MAHGRINIFEIVLLIVGIGAAYLGFWLINQVYIYEQTVSWLMLIAIFTWLILLILFTSLSVAVDVSKKQLIEMQKITDFLSKNKGKK